MSNDLPICNDDLSLDELARRAAEGDREALSTLIRQLQHPMYRLALRFLGHPDDAQDACQEILVRIVTRLGSFEGRSKFTTWAYTVAVHSLLRTRRRLVESSVQGAEQFAALLDAGIGEIDTTLEEVEYRLLCEEVRISCTYGMLLCLSRPQRAAYLLADVLGLTDADGAEILGCTREAFRQRGSRARRTLRRVIDDRCGLVDPANPCRCARQIASSEAAGILAAITSRSPAIDARRCGCGSNPSPSSSTPSLPSATSTASTVSPPPPSCGTTCSPGSPTC
jgi:RNA polymerase sigma factor (sigma-70 family)